MMVVQSILFSFFWQQKKKGAEIISSTYFATRAKDFFLVYKRERGVHRFIHVVRRSATECINEKNENNSVEN